MYNVCQQIANVLAIEEYASLKLFGDAGHAMESRSYRWVLPDIHTVNYQTVIRAVQSYAF